MIESTLSTASEVMRGRLCGADRPYRGISTDTRTLQAGELFFALQGPSYDGSEFVPAAAARQAAGAVVRAETEVRLPTIVVDDTRRALGKLAADWRRQLPVTLVGLTGSNGKTTLKEMIASCLALSAPTLATRGNLNNEIGLPLMLSELGPEHRYAVMEMGANNFGEIAWLTSLARPQVVAITNAGPAHLEGFRDVAGVARAKGEILQGSERPEHAVLNADERYFSYWKELAAGVPVTSFGLSASADFHPLGIAAAGSGSSFVLSGGGFEFKVELPLAGLHNVVHACAAAAVASLVGVEPDTIRRGLQAVRPVAGRLTPLKARAGAAVFDDSYNANPASVIAAAEFLARQEGEGWLVLGDMRELGDEAQALHRSVGRAVREAGVARLFAAGPLSRHAAEAFGRNAAWFDDVDDLAAAVSAELQAGVNVLVKGSRAMRMERVVQALCDVTPERN
jgi:UDP-N-acetylmuramoyl-tripeptide--D-alanyl-D-alanine ligase